MFQRGAPATGCGGLSKTGTRKSGALKIKTLAASPRRGEPAAGCAGINQAVTRNNFALKLNNLAASHRRDTRILTGLFMTAQLQWSLSGIPNSLSFQHMQF